MDDPLHDAHLRKIALATAVDLQKVWLKEGHVTASIEQQLDDTRYVANLFYAYLKGDTK